MGKRWWYIYICTLYTFYIRGIVLSRKGGDGFTSEYMTRALISTKHAKSPILFACLVQALYASLNKFLLFVENMGMFLLLVPGFWSWR